MVENASKMKRESPKNATVLVSILEINVNCSEVVFDELG